MSQLTTEELQAIAHRLGHYATSHGNLPLFKMARYDCDPEDSPLELEVGYRDAREVFVELAEVRERIGTATTDGVARLSEFLYREHLDLCEGCGMRSRGVRPAASQSMTVSPYTLFAWDGITGHLADGSISQDETDPLCIVIRIRPAGPTLCGLGVPEGTSLARTGPAFATVDSFWPKVTLCPDCEAAARGLLRAD